MLTDRELVEYLQKHQVPSAAQTYIREVRSGPPSRRVGLYARQSRACQYFSRKMGHTIQAESESVEYAYLIQQEYSDDCLEYWDQPTPISVTLTFENGRKQCRPHTPDCLLLTTEGPFLVECKTAEEAMGLTKSRPVDWKAENGQFIFMPGTTAAEAYGLRHRVYTPGASTAVLVGNLTLLLQSRLYPSVKTDDLIDRVRRAFNAEGYLPLKTLFERCGIDNLCPLLQLIDRHVIFARLSNDLLSNHASAWIALRTEYLPLIEDQRSPQEVVDVHLLPKEKALERALRILENLKSQDAPKRTLRYWKEKVEKAEARGESAFIGVLPNWHNSGNRDPRIVGERARFIATFIAENYPTDFKISTQRSYEKYRHAAKAFHPSENPIGIEAFKERVHADPVARAEAIGGKRAAHQAQPASDVKHRTLRPQRAFELAHIDHHLADIHLCVKVNGNKLFTIRVWLTAMVDSFSGAVLSFWISSRSPSRRACAMVLRRCLRAHKRLPENIITDHGAEFESTYYSALLASCGICKKDRPAGHPRFGSEAERLFQLFITHYTSTRPGRIRSILEGRGISKSHSSQATAQLTPELFIDEATGFFDWYNNVAITNDAAAPRLATLNENASLFGCCGLTVAYDHKFIIASAVETGSYSIDPSRGIQTTNGWFFDPVMCSLAGRRSRKLIAREDPENPHKVYALLDNQWRTLRSTADKSLSLATENQRLAAAIRINDGRFAKAAQREYANGVLIERMAENDKRLLETKVRGKTKATQNDAPEPRNVFQQASKVKLKPLSALFGRAL